MLPFGPLDLGRLTSWCWYLVLPLLDGCFVPRFLLPLCFLGGCGGCVLAGRESYVWDLDRCGQLGFWVKCVSSCWELTLRNEDGLGVDAWWDVQEEGKQGVLNLFSLLEMGLQKVVCHRFRDETGGLDIEERKE